MSKIPGIPDIPPVATAGLKLAQIVQLVKDNQLLTALLLFISWQLGIMAQATTYIGGVC